MEKVTNDLPTLQVNSLP